MKRIFTITLAMLFATALFAQEQEADTSWKVGTAGSITFSQVSLSNWAAGGESSYAAEGNFGFFANYEKNKTTWLNHLDLAYGLVKIVDDETKKSNDKIDFESKFGYQAGKKWKYSAMFNFRTQFTEGYNYDEDPKVVISDFMAPAYLILALGMDFTPNKELSILLSPITGKTTLVTDSELSDQGAYGVDPGKNAKHEYGALLKIIYNKKLMKNILFSSKADFFSAYHNHPENIDVNWEMVLDMKINKYFSTIIRTHMIYDHDTKITDTDGVAKPMLQFKESFGFGIAYSFPAKKE